MNSKEILNKYYTDYTLTNEWFGLIADLNDEYNLTNEEINILRTVPHDILAYAKAYIKYFDNNFIELRNFFMNYNFNSSQLQIIIKAVDESNGRLSLENICEVVNYKVPYNIMNWILSGLSDGMNEFNNRKYLEYDVDQLGVLYSAFKEGTDFSDYDDPSIDANTMNLVRIARSMGKTVEIKEGVLTIY